MTHPASHPRTVTSEDPASSLNLSDAELRAALGLGLARTLARQRGDYVCALVRDGVSVAQMSVLLKLRYHGDLSITGLASLLGLGLPNATGLVDRLEDRGYVERWRDPRDRRVVHIRLTPRGSRIPDGMEGLQHDVLWRVLQAMDRQTLERCLAVIHEVETQAGPAPVDPRCPGHGAPRTNT